MNVEELARLKKEVLDFSLKQETHLILSSEKLVTPSLNWDDTKGTNEERTKAFDKRQAKRQQEWDVIKLRWKALRERTAALCELLMRAVAYGRAAG